MNNSAQIHILEIILMSGIMFMALFFISNFEVPTHTTIGKENSLESLGEGILTSLDGIPDPGYEGDDTYYSSLLARYVHEIVVKRGSPYNLEPEEIEELQDLNEYFASSLPEGTLYNLSLIDVTKMSREGLSGKTIGYYTDSLHDPSVVLIGEIISTSRIVVIDGHIYNLVLCMSFTLK
jgi:hypothetical protein